jgi:hypothetical protein
VKAISVTHAESLGIVADFLGPPSFGMTMAHTPSFQRAPSRCVSAAKDPPEPMSESRPRHQPSIRA